MIEIDENTKTVRLNPSKDPLATVALYVYNRMAGGGEDSKLHKFLRKEGTVLGSPYHSFSGKNDVERGLEILRKEGFEFVSLVIKDTKGNNA